MRHWDKDMNDPHVEVLLYKADTDRDNLKYEDTTPVEIENQIGKFSLEDGLLTVDLADHYPDVRSAQHVVGPYLKAWEIEADISEGYGQIRFDFHRPVIIDRQPTPGTISAVQASGLALVLKGSRATILTTCNKYADPPTDFVASPDVLVAHLRWSQFREGKEPLQSMSYFILTLIESRSGGRRQAARDLQIDVDILRKIGELSSKKGDANTARKFNTEEFEKMTDTEKSWLEVAVKKIILRLGEHASGKSLARIRFADLPDMPG